MTTTDSQRASAARHHDVFVCYASEDKAVADAVVGTLEQAGVRCWIAPRDIVPGDSWAVEILRGIRAAQLVVFVLSSHSNRSPHVSRELERAVSEGLAVLPMRIEDVLPSSELEYFISNAHWLDALTPPLQVHLARLVDTVRFLLAERQAEQGLGTPAPVAPPTSTVVGTADARRGRWAAFMAIAGVLVAAVLILLGGLLLRRQSPTSTTVGPSASSATAMTTTTARPRSTTTTSATTSVVPHRSLMTAIEPGECFNGLADATNNNGTVEVVDCSSPHEGRYFARISYPEPDTAPYPGDSEVHQYSRGRCDTEFERQVTDPDERLRYITEPVYPTEQQWLAGEREIACYAWSTDAMNRPSTTSR